VLVVLDTGGAVITVLAGPIVVVVDLANGAAPPQPAASPAAATAIIQIRILPTPSVSHDVLVGRPVPHTGKDAK
jgi:hypothetical protein